MKVRTSMVGIAAAWILEVPLKLPANENFKLNRMEEMAYMACHGQNLFVDLQARCV